METIQGLIRPFISVAFVLLTAYLAVTGKVDAKEILTVTSIIVAFHFGASKQEAHNERRNNT